MRTEYDFPKASSAVIPQKRKTRISIFIDNAILENSGRGRRKAGSG